MKLDPQILALLSKLLEEWVEAQSQIGHFSDPADYVRGLIRRDQTRATKIAHIQRVVTEALDSGISPDSMSDIEQSGKIAL